MKKSVHFCDAPQRKVILCPSFTRSTLSQSWRLVVTIPTDWGRKNFSLRVFFNRWERRVTFQWTTLPRFVRSWTANPPIWLLTRKNPRRAQSKPCTLLISKRHRTCGQGRLNDSWRAVCAFVGVGYYFGRFARWMHFLFLAWAFFPRRVIFVLNYDCLDCQRNDKNSPTHDGDGDERKKRRADRESPLLGTCVLWNGSPQFFIV